MPSMRDAETEARELHPISESLNEGESIWLPAQDKGGWAIVYNAEGVACRMLWTSPMTPEEIALAHDLATEHGGTDD